MTESGHTGSKPSLQEPFQEPRRASPADRSEHPHHAEPAARARQPTSQRQPGARRIPIAFAIGIALSVLTLCLATALGSVNVPLQAVVRIIAARTTENLHALFNALADAFQAVASPEAAAPATPTAAGSAALIPGISPAWAGIVWNLRLPRALLAWITGAALSVSGAVMQSTLRNPLASSFTLGVSSGASLGAGLVIVGAAALPALTPFAGFSVPAAGFLFALLSIFAVMRFSRSVDPRLDNNTIILAGMVFSLFISACLTLLSALAGKEINHLIFWQMGSFALKGWAPVPITACALVASLIILLSRARELDILTFGEEEAQSIGVASGPAKRLLIGTVSALTGCVIAFVGVIGFIDLAVPHAIRRAFGPAHRTLIPLSALFGGSFMVLADLAARTALPPLDLPVGAVTALFGAPFFAWVFFSSRKASA